MIITYGWYAKDWWKDPATSPQYNCSADDRGTVLNYTLAAVIREFPMNESAMAKPNIVSIQMSSTIVF